MLTIEIQSAFVRRVYLTTISVTTKKKSRENVDRSRENQQQFYVNFSVQNNNLKYLILEKRNEEKRRKNRLHVTASLGDVNDSSSGFLFTSVIKHLD